MIVWLILAALAGLGAGQTAAAAAATTSGSTTTTYAAYNYDLISRLSVHPNDGDDRWSRTAWAGGWESADGVTPEDLPPHAQGFAAEASVAASSLSGARLSQHLGQLEKYGQAGFRELESGRFRYYGDITPASKPGEMIGRRLVREWDPSSGAMRTWHETVDGAVRTRIVRPETGGAKVHYYFDEFGNYGGSW
jgi:hypothetical protein